MIKELTPREREGCAKIAPFQDVLKWCHGWAEELKEFLTSNEMAYDAKVKRVENVGYDGFIPFTEGGIDMIASQCLSYDHDTGAAPKLIQPIIDSCLKDAQEEWDRRHPECTYEVIFGDEGCGDPDQLMLPAHPPRPEPYESQREEYYDFERTWLTEGSTYFWKARVLFYAADNYRNDTGEDEVLFCVGINDDLEYGRDSISWLPNGPKTHWLWEKTIPVRRLTEARVAVFARQARKAFENA
jgi:hypothetical protein